MSLFGRKKKVEVLEEVKTSAAPVALAKEEKISTKTAKTPVTPQAFDAGSILLRPRITEKAAFLSEKGVYAFDVAISATKKEVILAVAKIFNVHPIKVRMVGIKAKRVATRGTGKWGRKAGGKKAYVELKEGEKIELI